ncbi:MAG: hypothetical protein AB1502_03550 [Thermodesulfobacteriota bacterium]
MEEPKRVPPEEVRQKVVIDSCRIRIFSARKAKKKEMKQYGGYVI